MSYDVSIKVKVQDKPIYVSLGVGNANITWNVRELIKQSSGWEIKNCASNGSVLEWAEKIEHGKSELERNPKKYKQYEAKNGWGTIDGVLHFYNDCLDMVKWFKWGYGNGDENDLTDCAVVWVE